MTFKTAEKFIIHEENTALVVGTNGKVEKLLVGMLGSREAVDGSILDVPHMYLADLNDSVRCHWL